jgi:hypothetical protein
MVNDAAGHVLALVFRQALVVNILRSFAYVLVQHGLVVLFVLADMNKSAMASWQIEGIWRMWWKTHLVAPADAGTVEAVDFAAGVGFQTHGWFKTTARATDAPVSLNVPQLVEAMSEAVGRGSNGFSGAVDSLVRKVIRGVT